MARSAFPPASEEAAAVRGAPSSGCIFLSVEFFSYGMTASILCALLFVGETCVATCAADEAAGAEVAVWRPASHDSRLDFSEGVWIFGGGAHFAPSPSKPFLAAGPKCCLRNFRALRRISASSMSMNCGLPSGSLLDMGIQKTPRKALWRLTRRKARRTRAASAGDHVGGVAVAGRAPMAGMWAGMFDVLMIFAPQF